MVVNDMLLLVTGWPQQDPVLRLFPVWRLSAGVSLSLSLSLPPSLPLPLSRARSACVCARECMRACGRAGACNPLLLLLRINVSRCLCHLVSPLFHPTSRPPRRCECRRRRC